MLKHTLALLVSISVAAAPLSAATDTLEAIRQLAIKLYLEPLRITNATFQIETEPFAYSQEPHVFVIHVLSAAHPASELLRIDVVRNGRYLQYISAEGRALSTRHTHAVEAARSSNVAKAAQVLEDLAGFQSDRRVSLSRRSGFFEVAFTHPSPPAYVLGVTTGVFDENGILRIFGNPSIPYGE